MAEAPHKSGCNGHIRLFLDTEWADNIGSELVSLALVSDDGAHRFYCEVSPLPKEPTDFVRYVVYPLLEHGYAARQLPEVTRDLRAFLARFDEPSILFDYHVDGALLNYALGGFGLPSEIADRLGPMPKVTAMLITIDSVSRGIEQYFLEHPQLARRRHHAGVDVEALRWAYSQALQKGTS